MICLSKLSDNFFVVIIPTEYDLLMASMRKTEIVIVLLRSLFSKCPLLENGLSIGNAASYSSDRSKDNKDQKTLMRLEQKHRVARKSRLRKKDYSNQDKNVTKSSDDKFKTTTSQTHGSKAELFRTPILGGVQSATSAHGLPRSALALHNLMEQICSFVHHNISYAHRNEGIPFGSLVDFAPDSMGRK